MNIGDAASALQCNNDDEEVAERKGPNVLGAIKAKGWWCVYIHANGKKFWFTAAAACKP